MGYSHWIYALKRAIEQYGQNAEIKRDRKNLYGEPSEIPETICDFRGLFHTTNLFLALSHLEAGQKTSQNQPQFFILYRDDIKNKDLLYLGEKSYTITGINDLGNLHICIDLSLEEGDHV